MVINNISSRLPNSYLSRKSALVNASGKKNSAPPSGNILTNCTTEKLDEIAPVYITLMNDVNAAQAALSNYTPIRNTAFDDCRKMCTNMFSGIDLAIEMKILTQGDLVLRTEIIGPDTMTVTAEGFVTKEFTIDTSDDKPITMIVQLNKIITEE